jgi:hypothetical protein
MATLQSLVDRQVRLARRNSPTTSTQLHLRRTSPGLQDFQGMQVLTRPGKGVGAGSDEEPRVQQYVLFQNPDSPDCAKDDGCWLDNNCHHAQLLTIPALQCLEREATTSRYPRHSSGSGLQEGSLNQSDSIPRRHRILTRTRIWLTLRTLPTLRMAKPLGPEQVQLHQPGC